MYSLRKPTQQNPQLVLQPTDPFPLMVQAPTVREIARQSRTALSTPVQPVAAEWPTAPTPIESDWTPLTVAQSNSRTSTSARRVATPPRQPVEPTVAPETPVLAEPTDTAQRMTSTPLVFPAKPAKVETEANDIDQFHARLAKIQLEKKNLDETLRLIERIKSPSFKVKTLVDLAEYVSRDENYKREADQLYTLAIAGIDALAENKPITVTANVAPKQPEATKPTTTVEPTKRAPTLIDLGREIPSKPKDPPTLPPLTSIEEPKKPVDELPTLDAEPKKPVDELPTLDAEPKKPVDELPTLDAEPKKPVDELPTLDVEPKKPVDELPTLGTEPKTTLGTLPSLPKLAPEAPAATDSGKPRRRPLTISLDDEPATPEAVTTQTPPQPEATPKTETKTEEAPKTEAPPKTQRRPMPSGRRTVTLESN